MACSAPQPSASFDEVAVKWDPKDIAWSQERAILLKHFADIKSSQTATLDRFGGDATRSFPQTGHFRVARVDGAWMFVDPEGHPFLSMGVCTTKPIQTPDPEDMAPFQRLFGGKMENWTTVTSRCYDTMFLNTLGCWSKWDAFRKSLKPRPYTLDLALLSGYAKSQGIESFEDATSAYPKGRQPFFETGFAKYCERVIREKVVPYAKDPYLLGVFSDNEIVFYPKTLDVLLRAEDADTGHKAAVAWLTKRYPAEKDVEERAVTDADRNAFLQYFAGAYYRIVHETLRRLAPQVLDLGSRIDNERADLEGVMRAAGAYCDVVSINWYGTYNANPVTLERWKDWTGDKPLLVSEFYAKGDDKGFSNRGGMGVIVPTQEDRAKYYEQFTLGLLRSPNCVGWHWFCYIDTSRWLAKQPYGTGSNNGHDSNKGLFDRNYQPYQPLADTVARVNWNAYSLKRYFQQRNQGLLAPPMAKWVEKCRLNASRLPDPQFWLVASGNDSGGSMPTAGKQAVIARSDYLEVGSPKGVTLSWSNPLRGGVRVRCRFRVLDAGQGSAVFVLHGESKDEGYAFELGTSEKIPGMVFRNGKAVRSCNQWLSLGKTYTFDASSTFENGFGEVRLLVDNHSRVGFRDESALKGKSEPGFTLLLPPGARIAVEELVLWNAPV